MTSEQSLCQITEADLKVEDIRMDPALQTRLQIDQQAVREYAEDMGRDGLEAFPSVVVFDDGSELLLVDGFHRLEAAKSLGHESIRCRVHSGNKAEARWFACGCNRSHGLRRSNADKQRAVMWALECDPTKSDAEIARHVGVCGNTVAKYRDQLASTSKIPESNQRVGADGRLMNTANIGSRSRQPKPKVKKQADQSDCTSAAAADQQSPPTGQPDEGGHSETDGWAQLREWLQCLVEERGHQAVWAQLRGVLDALDFDIASTGEPSPQEEVSGGEADPEGSTSAVVQDWVSVELSQ